MINTNADCGICGAEYTISYDEDQFGIEAEEPTICPFCGSKLDQFTEEANMDELDFQE
jgi:hypothetical protein